MADTFSYSAKTARVGDEVVLEINGDTYRAVVMLAGGWTRSDRWENHRPEGPAYFHEKRSMWCAMIRGGGSWIAFAAQPIFYGVNPDVESKNWSPMFATAGRVFNTWEAHKQHLRVQYQRNKDYQREHELRDKTTKALMRHIVFAMYGAQEGEVVYENARGFARPGEVDITGDKLAIRGAALEKLAEAVHRNGSSPMVEQLQQQQAQILELTKKLELADEKISALKFILNR
jgi:hypothetical protein